MAKRIPDITDGTARFEKISVPPDESFLWRLDDYPWSRNVWNYHPEFEIHLVRHSTGLCYIGDHIGHFEPGHISLVGSDLPHDWVTLPFDGEKLIGRDIVIQFSPEIFIDAGKYLPELRSLEGLFHRASLGLEFIGNTAIECARLIEKMADLSGPKRFAKMVEMLALMSDTEDVKTLSTQNFVSKFKRTSALEHQQLETALAFIQEHYTLNPKLSEVAKSVGMSETSFSRFFKTQTGNTYSDHLQILRIWTAKKLLRDTNIPVTEICYEAGFSNISNFNRTFLRHTDMKPSQYRKALEEIKT